MTKIILFNGPPRAGKDTLASQLQAELSAQYKLFVDVNKFAAPLKRTACSIYCEGNTKEWFEFDSSAKKDIADEVFFGKTPREIQIAISEQYMKPVHGQKVFGKLLAQTIKRSKDRFDGFLISDSGFRPEAEELVEQFGVENVILVRLKREGFTYEGDSRDYIDLSDLGVETFDVENVEGQPEIALKKILEFAPQFIKNKD